MAIVQTEGLTYVYGEGTPYRKTAVTDVSFAITEPGIVAIIGHTGSGKSTLIEHLNGLMKPTAGTVMIGDKNIWDDPKQIRQVRFRVGLVFQYPEYQLFDETVRSDIGFGPRNIGLEADEIERRVLWAADTVGIKHDLLDKSPFDLSGGEKRRVAIAGVLAMRPEVLILDEPTAGLDPKGRDRLLRCITDYQRQNNTAVIMVSHSMEDVARVADRVIVMNDGHIELDGGTREVFGRSEQLRRCGLGVPEVSRIADQLRALGVDVPSGLLTVDEMVKALLPMMKGGDCNA